MIYKLFIRICISQPSGLLAFLESTDAPPAQALESDKVEERDNLSLAQATVKPRAAHWEALERQVKYVEKHLEVSTLDYFIPIHSSFFFNEDFLMKGQVMSSRGACMNALMRVAKAKD